MATVTGTQDGPYSQGYEHDVWGNVTHKYGWGGEVQGGGAGESSDIWYSYSNGKNQRDSFVYDATGNLTNDLGQTFAYDATGQQTYASGAGGGWGAPPPLDDNPLKDPNNPESFKIKAIHITQLRNAINSLREHLGLADYVWVKPTASGGAINNTVLISWEPIDEMRTALNEALGPPSPPYADGLTLNQPILAAHIQELRDRVTTTWNAHNSSGLYQSYDGDSLRVKKTEYGATTYYLRSTVLGGQVVAELDGGGNWSRGYVYAGSNLMAVQQGGVFWTYEDPVTKSKRVCDVNGNVVSAIELDPWGADTNRSGNAAFQPRKFTTYDRDGNGSDEAMFRRYNRQHSRFDQPDPSGGSYDFSDPQSFNRYAYTKNDPVNLVDPSGLDAPLTCLVDGMPWDCGAAFGLVDRGAATVANGPGFYGDYLVINHEPRRDGDRFYQSVYYVGPPQNRWRFSEDQGAILERTLKIAGDALRRPECAAFLAGISEDPLKTLTDLAQNTGQKGKGFINMSDVRPKNGNTETIAEAVRVLGFGFGSGPAVALYGGFFDDRSEFGLNPDHTRALDLLHELGHVTRAYFHSPIPDFFGFGKNMSQAEVDKGIYNNCFRSPLPRSST